MEEYNSKKRLTREQKTGFVLLLVFACLVMSLGILQIRNNIFSPFVIHLTETDYEEASLFQDESARLQSIDTDHDGLNDYEELNFYETSPYLPDTDSDGLRDKLEIEQGTNPLCPEGEDCGLLLDIPVISTTTEMITSPLAEITDPVAYLEDFSQGISTDDLAESFEDMDKMRELLLQTGMIDEVELNNLSNEELEQIINEILASQTAGSFGEEI
ncbi:MAG: thrombospondin type 3 repeat-containing protein [Candidatus Magasanikbacteria bacterium]